MSKPDQYPYLIRPTRSDLLATGPSPEEAALIAEHFDYLRKLRDDHTVMLAGRTQGNGPDDFGLVLFEASSEEEARRFMDANTAVEHVLMSAELFPFRIALAGETISEEHS